MVHRGVAKKLTQAELDAYRRPVYYVSYHEDLKSDSKSTPVRIIFNSSANFMGHILNDYWAKEPDLLNNMLGVLIRFRENEVAIMGDINVSLRENWNCKEAHTLIPVARYGHYQSLQRAWHVHHPNRIIRRQASRNHCHRCPEKNSWHESEEAPTTAT